MIIIITKTPLNTAVWAFHGIIVKEYLMKKEYIKMMATRLSTAD